MHYVAPCLVDTNVISEIIHNRPNAGVLEFLKNRRVLLSCIAFAELSYGAHSLKDTHPKRKNYLHFIENLKIQYKDSILPVSLDISEKAGKLRASEKQAGRILEMADSLIAASAIQTGATLVTRNTKDFEHFDIVLLNPFSIN